MTSLHRPRGRASSVPDARPLRLPPLAVARSHGWPRLVSRRRVPGESGRNGLHGSAGNSYAWLFVYRIPHPARTFS